MANERIYSYYAYLAGIRVPMVSMEISTNYGNLASASVEVQYSPFILHIHEQTKIQIWEQIESGTTLSEPTLEFDGVVIGVVRNKNVLGNVSVRLNCVTDGIVWNRRKQFDFYLEDITEADARGTGDVLSMRADGVITNFFTEVMSTNRFDAGCAAASVLTMFTQGKVQKIKNKFTMYNTAYEYVYNGKKFYRNLESKQANSSDIEASQTTPAYYRKFLDDFKLANKVYGVSTSQAVKDFFQQDRFIQMITTNSCKDLLGENTFWSIATQVLGYGFYSIYDIPNPTFIPGDTKKVTSYQGIDLSSFATNNNKVEIKPFPNKTTCLEPSDYSGVENKRDFHGLAEYIFKPISVLGLPLECNIIWPDQVISESLFYDFMSTPTRVIMTKHALPGESRDIVLTSQKIVGPAFKEAGFFDSLTVPYSKVRETGSTSKYELEYGINYHQLQLSYAFDAALLEEKFKDEKNEEAINDLGQKMNNFLNYEFSQRYLSSRNYSIQVTPDVNVVVGLPVCVLNKTGEHIIAFVTGVRKGYNASGSKQVTLSVAYPRFYYEDIGALGNVIDPSSTELFAAKELALLFGSKALVNPGAYEDLPGLLEEIFSGYMGLRSDDDREVMKSAYQRKVCTFAQFMQLYNNAKTSRSIFNMPPEYLTEIFESTNNANVLSNHKFKVYDSSSKKVEEQNNLPNQTIIAKHLEWCSEAQVI